MGEKVGKRDVIGFAPFCHFDFSRFFCFVSMRQSLHSWLSRRASRTSDRICISCLNGFFEHCISEVPSAEQYEKMCKMHKSPGGLTFEKMSAVSPPEKYIWRNLDMCRIYVVSSLPVVPAIVKPQAFSYASEFQYATFWCVLVLKGVSFQTNKIVCNCSCRRWSAFFGTQAVVLRSSRASTKRPAALFRSAFCCYSRRRRRLFEYHRSLASRRPSCEVYFF